MATATDIVTNLTLNTSNFDNGISRSVSKIEQFTNTVKHIAEAVTVFEVLERSVHFFISTIEEGTQQIEELANASLRLGVGVGALQELQYAAEQSGLKVDGLNRSIAFMEAAIGKGTKPAIEALKTIGLTLDDLKGKTGTEQFTLIGTAIGKLTDQTEKATVAKTLFGRAGIQNLSLFNRDIHELTEEFKAFGGELTGSQAQAVKSYAESIKKLSAIWGAFEIQLTVAVAGPFKAIIDAIVETTKRMGGVGQVAKLFASAIIDGVQVAISGFVMLANHMDSIIIKGEKLVKLLLQINQFATLGLSKVLSNSDADIAALTKDINARQASLGNRNNTSSQISSGLSNLQSKIGASAQSSGESHKVDVTVRAESGLSVSVAESPAIRTKVNKIMNDYLAQSASSVGQ